MATTGNSLFRSFFVILFLLEINCGTVFQGNLSKDKVLKFNMNSALDMQSSDGVYKSNANSRKKRDVSESGACKDQEQNFLQSVLNNNKSGFLNTVSIPDLICRNTLKFLNHQFELRCRST